MTTLNFFYHFQLIPFQKIFYSCRIYYIQHFFMDAWPQTFYLSTLLKLNFFSLDFQHNFLKLKSQSHTYNFFKYNNIQPVSSARNLGIIFDSNLSFFDTYISKSCFSHIRNLRRKYIRTNTLDHKTACTIATSLIHKLDYTVA